MFKKGLILFFVIISYQKYLPKADFKSKNDINFWQKELFASTAFKNALPRLMKILSGYRNLIYSY